MAPLRGYAGGVPKPTPLRMLTRTSPNPFIPDNFVGPQGGLEQVTATFLLSLLCRGKLLLSVVRLVLPPPVAGLQRRASTHAGQEAEVAQADAHDDARD